ncbi:hypothetical protein C1646_768706 [Rhizophagus diaphanus]|nr:hypothetical protein C1646_768706 [Rhizophagus diaphanus] [Rhizophagus sp. MUCL 43196]
MKSDVRLCEWEKENEEVPHEYVEMTVRERLIGEEINHHKFEDKGEMSLWLDIEEWRKVITILQENEITYHNRIA